MVVAISIIAFTLVVGYLSHRFADSKRIRSCCGTAAWPPTDLIDRTTSAPTLEP